MWYLNQKYYCLCLSVSQMSRADILVVRKYFAPDDHDHPSVHCPQQKDKIDLLLRLQTCQSKLNWIFWEKLTKRIISKSCQKHSNNHFLENFRSNQKKMKFKYSICIALSLSHQREQREQGPPYNSVILNLNYLYIYCTNLFKNWNIYICVLSIKNRPWGKHIVAKIPDDSDSQKNEWFPDFFPVYGGFSALLWSEARCGKTDISS